MIIDTHAHLWRRDRHPQPWIDPGSAIDRDFWVEDLARAQEASGIDGAIVVQAAHALSEGHDLLAASDGRVIRGVVAWVDVEGDVAAQLSALRSGVGGHRLVGIRHLAHVDPDPGWLDRPSVGAGFEALDGLPFDLVVRADQLELAARVVARHPGVSFVLDHIGKPPITAALDEWRSGLLALAALPNVVAKLSGITIEASWATWTTADLAPAARIAIDAFGPSRLMFGSDWPLVDLCGGLDAWLSAATELTEGFSPAERSAFFGGTAAATYSLELPDA